MKWSEIAWSSIEQIYNKIVELDFIKELMLGTLDKNKFEFYIQQDAIYLSDYGKVLTGIVQKLNKIEHVTSFVHFASDSIAVENALHSSFLKDIDKNNIITTPSPSCLLYTSYLVRQLATAPVEVIAAAVLPCFWIYKKVGDYILENQTKDKNIYQTWIDTYGGEDFSMATKRAIEICDELAAGCTKEQLDKMTEAFIMSSKLEYMFWDSAYRLEQWCI